MHESTHSAAKPQPKLKKLNREGRPSTSSILSFVEGLRAGKGRKEKKEVVLPQIHTDGHRFHAFISLLEKGVRGIS
jgi:hypothetical protein